jgi:AraC-like DNA-binding protein
MPEMDAVRPLLDRSRRGLLFDDATSAAVRPLIEKLLEAQGLKRLALFWEILALLVDADYEVLASLSFQLDLSGTEDSGINRALSHLRENLTDQVEESELAAMVGQSPSAFSRAFKRHTGTTLVRYRNQLRIDLACKMLLADLEVNVAEVCYDVGFSNLSNFNRHFLKLKGMSPSQFRSKFTAQKAFMMAD